MREIVERLQERRQIELAKEILESKGYKVMKESEVPEDMVEKDSIPPGPDLDKSKLRSFFERYGGEPLLKLSLLSKSYYGFLLDNSIKDELMKSKHELQKKLLDNYVEAFQRMYDHKLYVEFKGPDEGSRYLDWSPADISCIINPIPESDERRYTKDSWDLTLRLNTDYLSVHNSSRYTFSFDITRYQDKPYYWALSIDASTNAPGTAYHEGGKRISVGKDILKDAGLSSAGIKVDCLGSDDITFIFKAKDRKYMTEVAKKIKSHIEKPSEEFRKDHNFDRQSETLAILGPYETEDLENFEYTEQPRGI